MVSPDYFLNKNWPSPSKRGKLLLSVVYQECVKLFHISWACSSEFLSGNDLGSRSVSHLCLRVVAGDDRKWQAPLFLCFAGKCLYFTQQGLPIPISTNLLLNPALRYNCKRGTSLDCDIQ